MLIDQFWIELNGLTGRRHTRRVPDGKVAEIMNGTFRHDLHFAAVKRVQAHGLLGWLIGLGQQFFT
jgi:hypothetical protein